MRITTSVTFQMTDVIGEYIEIERHSFEYRGPVAECKKGRGQAEANMKAGAAQSAINNANSNAAYNTAQSLLQGDIGSTTPGSLTPAAQAQLAADNDNISRVYNGLRQQAFTTLGQRGFNNAPSGFTIAAMNGVNNAQAQDETNAYRQGQLNTQNQRNFATTQEGSLSGQQGQLGAANLGQSTNSAVAYNRAGSTLGDVAQGVGDVVGLVSPTIGAVQGIGRAFRRIGQSGFGQTPFGQSNGYGGTYSS